MRRLKGVSVVFPVLLFFVMAIARPFPAVTVGSITVRYVAPTGSDSGHCLSPLSPCRTIQYAVNQAASGDIILVAGGYYYYNAGVDPCPFLQTRAVVCFVDKQLTILGGYSTTNWSLADPGANPTIIDGENTYRGVAVIGYNTTTTHLEMQGFTIQNCRAQGPTYLSPYDPSGVGGGMLVQHASVTLKEVIFRNNQAVGQNTDFGAGGQADGAALRIEEPPPGTVSYLRQVVFEGNKSFGGTGPERGGVAFGALFIYKANVIVEDAIFTNNLARAGDSSGSGNFGNPRNADALGGGIAIQEGTVVLRRVTVTDNQVRGGNATEKGGGAYGGGIFVENFGNPANFVTVSDSYIAYNIAVGGTGATGGQAAGGGIDVDSSNITIERTYIISNSVIGGNSTSTSAYGGIGAGGGVYMFPGWSGTYKATLNNVVIAWNAASQGSGLSHPGYGGGGGIVIHGINADINNATIAHNRINSPLVLGQGLLVQPWPSPDHPQQSATVNINNSIIANHTEGGPSAAAVVVQSNSTVTFSRGLFTGNIKDTNADGSPVPVGTINGLTTMDSASSAGFVSAGPPYFNYHLRMDSPAVDKGIKNLEDDIDRQPRPFGESVDFGADEYHPFTLVAVPRDQTLFLDWTTGSQILKGGVGHYEVFVICAVYANPPNEIGCEQPLNTTSTALTLTGLTNFKPYTIEVKAYDTNGVLMATSVRISAIPTNIFVFLPLVLR